MLHQISSSGSLTAITEGAFGGGQLEQTLVALKLPGNGFESIPDEISELRNLQSLDLSENKLSSANNSVVWRSLAALELLDLSNNSLIDLTGLVLPRSLKKLTFSHNQVKN